MITVKQATSTMTVYANSMLVSDVLQAGRVGFTEEGEDEPQEVPPIALSDAIARERAMMIKPFTHEISMIVS